MLKTAVIAGSTGLTGKFLLNNLLADPGYHQVYSLVRQNTGKSFPKLIELQVSFDEIPYSLQEIKHADDVYCCLGTTMKKAGSRDAFRKVDYEYPLKLATWAREIKAAHFLCMSAVTADVGSKIFYNQVKGEMERDISLLPIPAITFFRPSLILGERSERRTGEKIAMNFSKAISFMLKGSLKKYKPVEAQVIAASMITNAKSQRVGKEIVWPQME